MENRYEQVFWIDASNKDTLEHSYKNIASKIRSISDTKYSLEEALRELGSYQSRWLLLFDGADNLEDIAGLFPPGIHGDIIYTSRNGMLRRLSESQMQHVSDMNDDEASELLLKSARVNTSSETDREQALGIVHELGHLALAIDQAGAYIASGGCCLDDFLDTFKVHHEHLLQNDAYKGASENDKAVYATWDLSYAAIARQADSAANEDVLQGPKAALQILRVVPFLHNEDIMEDIFRYAAQNPKYQSEVDCEAEDRFPSALLYLRPDGSWDSRNFRRGLQKLLSFSLIRQESSQPHFSMHRLVHLWAYDRLTVAERNLSGIQTRDVLTRSVNWRYESRDFAFRRDLLPHIMNFQRQTSLFTESPEGEGMAEFALVFWEAGRWKEAEKLNVRVVETRKRVLGEEHPDTLSSIYNLAITYWNQGRWKEAEELEVRVLEVRKKVLGVDHPNTLSSMHNLACTYWDQERWEEAISLLKECIQLRTQILGLEHPSTQASLEDLNEWDREISKST